MGLWEKVIIFMVVAVVAGLIAGAAMGVNAGMGQSQMGLDVGEYEIFHLAPNPMDEATLVAIVRGKKEVSEPIYVTIGKNEFRGPTTLEPSSEKRPVIVVTHVTDVSGKHTIYEIVMK